MEWYKIAAVAIGLGMDAMSVCAALGVKWHGPRQRFRLAWHAGLFQFMMPIIGWFLGSEMAGLAKDFGAYIAGGLVIAVGLKMLYEALRSHPGDIAEKAEHAIRGDTRDPTRGWSLVVLSVATSLDALVVGFSLGIGGSEGILGTSIVIGLVAGVMSLIGIAIGKRVGQAIGKPAEILGAVVLIGLGISFLWM